MTTDSAPAAPATRDSAIPDAERHSTTISRVAVRRPTPAQWTVPSFEVLVENLPPLPPLPPHVGNLPFVHKSWLAERLGQEGAGARVEQGSQKRSEFLGDSVLAMYVSLVLFEHPSNPETGVASDMRSALVSNAVWSLLDRAYRLHDAMLLGAAAEQANYRENQKLVADTFEAYIGQLWLAEVHQPARSSEASALLKWVRATFNTTVFPHIDRELEASQARVIQARIERAEKQKQKKLEREAKKSSGSPEAEKHDSNSEVKTDARSAEPEGSL